MLNALFKKGRLRDVLVRASRLAKSYPDEMALQNMIYAAYAGLGENAKAISRFRLVVKRDPAYPQAHHNLGVLYRRIGDSETALSHARKALAVEPANVDRAAKLSVYLTRSGKTDEAIDILVKLSEQVPRKAEWQEKLGDLLRFHGQKEAALAAYRGGLALDRSNPNVHASIATCLSDLQQFEEATRHFHKAMALGGDKTDVLLRIGRHFKNRGQLNLSAQTYKRVIDLDPNSAYAYGELGQVLNRLGRTDESVGYYEQGLKLDSENPQLQHLVAALKGTTTRTAPRQYVIGLFDDYADRFEESLVSNLEYHMPAKLAELLGRTCGETIPVQSALDLGCGTGLLGEALRDMARTIDGVDLSPRMIDIAGDKGVYRDLSVNDIADGIIAKPGAYDLYASADVLIYVGDLEEMFAALQQCAKPGALVLLSAEDEEGDGYSLRTSGRYAHSKAYVEMLAARFGMTNLAFETDDLRKEGTEMLVGGLHLLQVG